MGTKRRLAPLVACTISEFCRRERVVDLFSGVGAVAEALADRHYVHLNDNLAFVSALNLPRFGPHMEVQSDTLATVRQKYLHGLHIRIEHYRQRLEDENESIDGGLAALQNWMINAPHVGNSEEFAARAATASTCSDERRYSLCLLYFSAGYYSTAQSIAFDALRYGIDHQRDKACYNQLIAAYIVTAARLINAPGHTAQYLKPSGNPAYARIRRQWRRSVWSTFISALDHLRPVGSASWRARNVISRSDATTLLTTLDPDRVGLVYADPPYTKDHYSRYYHVYETLYLYDFPDARGMARARTDRLRSDFGVATKVVQAFNELGTAVRQLGVPLVLSYPQSGLLAKHGLDPPDILAQHLRVKLQMVIPVEHSTLGASKGYPTRNAVEHVYVCDTR